MSHHPREEILWRRFERSASSRPNRLCRAGRQSGSGSPGRSSRRTPSHVYAGPLLRRTAWSSDARPRRSGFRAPSRCCRQITITTTMAVTTVITITITITQYTTQQQQQCGRPSRIERAVTTHRIVTSAGRTARRESAPTARVHRGKRPARIDHRKRTPASGPATAYQRDSVSTRPSASWRRQPTQNADRSSLGALPAGRILVTPRARRRLGRDARDDDGFAVAHLAVRLREVGRLLRGGSVGVDQPTGSCPTICSLSTAAALGGIAHASRKAGRGICCVGRDLGLRVLLASLVVSLAAMAALSIRCRVRRGPAARCGGEKRQRDQPT